MLISRDLGLVSCHMCVSLMQLLFIGTPMRHDTLAITSAISKYAASISRVCLRASYYPMGSNSLTETFATPLMVKGRQKCRNDTGEVARRAGQN